MADKSRSCFFHGCRCSSLVAFIIPLLFLPTFYSAEAASVSAPFELLSNVNSPASTILDMTPEMISRPYTLRELSASIITATDTFRILPKGYELEFAPYWMFAGKKIGYNEYIGNKIGQNFLQSVSISFASLPEYIYVVPPDLPPSSVAFGTRFSLLRGEVTSDFKKAVHDIATLAKEYNHQLFQLAKTILATEAIYNDPNTPDEKKEERMDEIRDSVEILVCVHNPSLCEAIDQKTSNLHIRRTGPKVDVAGAIALNLPPGGGLNDIELLKGGGWVTTGYEGQKWSGFGFLRYTIDFLDPDQTGLDIGIKGISDKPEQRLSWSTEGVLRWLADADLRVLRLSATANYRVQSNALVSVTFGHELGPHSSNPIVSVNLSLSFGGQELVLPVELGK